MKVNVIGDSETILASISTLLRIIIAGGTIKGMELEGPLRLNLEGTEDNEAVTKEYVDSLSGDVEASNVTRGTMPFARFPEMDGELTKEEGSSDIVLNNSGVVAGNYPKVTVTPKGIITEGEELEATDIPNFGWEKVSERPVTLAGYGIEDGVRKDDGVVLGNLKTVSHPSRGDDAVTVGYLDMKINDDIRELNPGDIIEYMGDTTPYGMLQCNGGILSKEMYPELYAAIGDRFTNVSIGAGKPWFQLSRISSNNTPLPEWVESEIASPVPNDNEGTVFVTSNLVYLIGRGSKSVYRTTIKSTGELGEWVEDNHQLPLNSTDGQPLVINNRIYIFAPNGTNNIIYSDIGIDGYIGEWSTHDIKLPASMDRSRFNLIGNSVYIFGYFSGSHINDIYRSDLTADGDLGEFYKHATAPKTMAHTRVAVFDEVVYLIGRYNSNAIDIFRGEISGSDVTNFRVIGTEPIALSDQALVVTDSSIYMFGGRAGANPTNKTYMFPVDSGDDYKLGSLSEGTPLPTATYSHAYIATSSRIYLFTSTPKQGGGYVIYESVIPMGLDDYSEYYSDQRFMELKSFFQLPNLNKNGITDYYIKH